MEMTKNEKLAFLKALEKMVKKELSVIEAEAKDEVMAGYIRDGRDRYSIIIGDAKVGEIGLSYSKAKPAIKPGCELAALVYLGEHGLTELKPVKDWEKRFERIGFNIVDKETGEVVDWAEWLPKTANTAAIRDCKPEDVIPALEREGFMFNAMLSGLIAGLLEG